MAEPIDETETAPAPVAQYTDDGRVYVRSAGGGLESVPEDQVERYVLEGRGTLATQTDLAERARQKEYGEGIVNELVAGAEGAADAVTLGAYSAGRRIIGGDEAADATRTRRELNPLAATTGGLVGIGATALATGGTGLIGTAARLTPAGAAIRLGLAAERGIAGASALSRIGAAATAGAVEGAIFGLGEGVQDAALSEDQRDRMAEHLMVDLAQRAGSGALFGALAGGGFGAGVEGLRGLAGTAKKLAQRAQLERALTQADDAASPFGGLVRTSDDLVEQSDDLARSSSRSKALGEGESLSSAMARSKSGAGAEYGTQVSFSLGRKGPERDLIREFGEAASARNRFQGVQQEATERVTRLVNENNRVADDILSEANVGLKKHPVKALLERDPPANIDATGQTLLQTLETIDDDLANALAKPNVYNGRAMQAFERARKEIETTANALRMPRNTDDLAEAFIGVDRLKRRFGRIQQFAGSGLQGDAGGQQLLRQHYENMRAFLEDGASWGTGATQMQREVNAAWSKYLDFAQAYERRLTLRDGVTRSARDGFERIAEADPSKIGGVLKAAGDVENSFDEKVLLDGSRLHTDLLEALGKHYEVSGGLRTAVNQAKKNAAEIAEQLGKVRKVKDQAAKWEEMISGMRDIPFIGGLVSGTVTTTGRAVASAEAASRVVALARVKASAVSGAQAISKAARSVVRRTGTMVRVPAATLGGAAVTRAQKRKDFDRIYSAVREYESDPASAVRRAFRLQNGIGTVAPLLAAAYAAKTTAAASFLSEKLPRHEPPSSPFERVDETKAPPVSADELDTFLRYARAVENPLSVIEDIERGTITPEAVEALRAVYPGIYQQVQLEILEEVEQAEEPPSYRQRLNLGILFDLTTDPALEPEFLGMLQQSAQQSQAGLPGPQAQASQPLAPSRRSTPEVSSLHQTSTQALAARN